MYLHNVRNTCICTMYIQNVFVQCTSKMYTKNVHNIIRGGRENKSMEEKRIMKKNRDDDIREKK